MASSDTARPGEGRKGDITKYMKYVTDFVGNTSTNRRQQKVDVGYYHGDQLTPYEMDRLNARGQPILIINRVRAAVNGILGVVVQKKTQPKAWPRTPKDEDSADVATDTLRFLSDSTDMRNKLVEADTDLLNAGNGALMITVDQKTKAISLVPVSWSEFIYDPRSRKHDFSDAKYLGVSKWQYVDDVKAKYPSFDAENAVAGSSMGGLDDEVGQDRPRANMGWISTDKQRVLVIELYYSEGGNWYKVVFTSGGVLEEGPSWLKDGSGGYSCPLIAESVYVDDDNNRRGVVKDMRYLQDEINKRRSKLLHLLSVAQIQAKDPSAIELDADAARLEAARADGVIPFGWERVRNSDIVQGQAQLLAESKAELERMGPNPAILGRQGSDTSGKALATRQEAGMVELAIVFSRMDNLELRVYRALWMTAQQFWTAPQFVRVTDEVEDPKFVSINEPVMGQVPGVDPTTGQPAVDPATGGPIMVQDVLGYKNQIATLDVDIILDIVPGTATLQAEQLGVLMDLIARNPQYADIVPPEVLFELTPMPRKREIMKKIQAASAAAAQNKQAQAQHEAALAEAETQSKIDLNNAGATLDTAKAQELGYNAVTYAQQTHNSLVTSVMQARQKAQADSQKADAARSNGNPSPGK